MPSCAVWPDHLTSMHVGEIEVDERDREIAVRDQIDRGEANGPFVIDHENAGCTPLHLTTLKRGTTRPVVIKSDRRHHATRIPGRVPPSRRNSPAHAE